MKLVPDEAATEAEVYADEKPAAPLTIPLAEMLPVGMIESLKAIRHEIAQLHSTVVNGYGMVPAFLSGAYTAIEDAETFLKNVTNGKEEFTPVPKKPVVKEENKPYQGAHGTMIKVPSNLRDIPYMQEWAGQFFFPTLREMTVRKDVEVNLQANEDKKKKLTLSLVVTTKDAAPVVLPGRYKANSVIDLAAVAKSIDAL